MLQAILDGDEVNGVNEAAMLRAEEAQLELTTLKELMQGQARESDARLTEANQQIDAMRQKLADMQQDMVVTQQQKDKELKQRDATIMNLRRVRLSSVTNPYCVCCACCLTNHILLLQNVSTLGGLLQEASQQTTARIAEVSPCEQSAANACRVSLVCTVFLGLTQVTAAIWQVVSK